MAPPRMRVEPSARQPPSGPPLPSKSSPVNVERSSASVCPSGFQIRLAVSRVAKGCAAPDGSWMAKPSASSPRAPGWTTHSVSTLERRIGKEHIRIGRKDKRQFADERRGGSSIRMRSAVERMHNGCGLTRHVRGRARMRFHGEAEPVAPIEAARSRLQVKRRKIRPGGVETVRTGDMKRVRRANCLSRNVFPPPSAKTKSASVTPAPAPLSA